MPFGVMKMSKIEKIINGETFTFYQQDFLVNKIRDPEDLPEVLNKKVD